MDTSSLLSAFGAVREAFLCNDVGTLRSLIAPDYRGFDPYGAEHDREMLLQAYEPGGVLLDTYETSEVEARILGDVGLVMGVGSLSGKYGEHDFAHDLRFLDVYAFRNGAWQLLVSQSTERAHPPG